MMEFNKKLKALIEENNITQKSVAQGLSIAPSTIGGYVQGTSEPDFETLKRIAVYFGVSTDYLLGVPEKITCEKKERELLRVFRSLTDEQQNIYIEQGKAFLCSNKLKKETRHISSREKE